MNRCDTVNPLVSVIIPVFNSEKYLDRCLNSVCGQTYRELEIILVNDGSRDSSIDICKRWQSTDPRIRIIDQPNQGAAAARNAALEVFEGTYVCFADSDDEIGPDTINKAVQVITRDASDLVLFGMNIVEPDSFVSRTYIPHFDRNVYEGDDIRTIVLDAILLADESDVNRPSASCCVNLYSNRIFREKGIRFRPLQEIFSEDIYATLEIYTCIDRVSVISDPFYMYHMNPGSESHKHDFGRYAGIGGFYHEARRLYSGYDTLKDHIACSILGSLIGEIKNIAVDPELGFGMQRKMMRTLFEAPDIRTVVLNVDMGILKPVKKILINMIKYRMYGLCIVLFRIRQGLS